MTCREQRPATADDIEAISKSFHLDEAGFKVLHQLEVTAEQQKVGTGTPLSTSDTSIVTLWHASAKGCDECNHTGYKGRIGIYEALNNSLAIQKLIISNATSNQIQAQAISEGMVTMQVDGLVKAMRGQSSLEEILRVTKD
jgi:type II secretory ATPase GspE/PulE/Tfp pilus assembly ATPase PilB-like protein